MKRMNNKCGSVPCGASIVGCVGAVGGGGHKGRSALGSVLTVGTVPAQPHHRGSTTQAPQHISDPGTLELSGGDFVSRAHGKEVEAEVLHHQIQVSLLILYLGVVISEVRD